MTPIQPFCIASNNGIVYAVSFAYIQTSTSSTSPYPDWFIFFKGFTSTGLQKDLNWTVVTFTPRNNVGIFPGVSYIHACGVSHDGSMFMLHSQAENGSQEFSVQIPTSDYSVIQYLTDTYQSSGGDSARRSGAEGSPYLLMPTADFSLPVANTSSGGNNGSTTSPIPLQSSFKHQDWIYLQSHSFIATADADALAMFRSIDGTFPTYPQGIMIGSWPGNNGSSTPDLRGLAYQKNILYSLYGFDENSRLLSLGLSFNASDPTWPGQINSANYLDLGLTPGNCQNWLSNMVLDRDTLHIFCTGSKGDTAALYTHYNILDKTGVPTRVSLPAQKDYGYWNAYPRPYLAPVSNTSTLLSDGINLFWMDDTGTFEFYNLGSVGIFVTENPNPDMTKSPLTFSGTITFAIVIGALVLAAIFVWIQRLFFKWRASKWIDGSDIPGSKVAEELDENDPNYNLGRQGQGQGQQPQHSQSHHVNPANQSPDYALGLYVPPSNSVIGSETSLTTQSLTVEGGGSNNSPSGGQGRSDELELVTFSSHPRPNIVTSITDGSFEEALTEPR